MKINRDALIKAVLAMLLVVGWAEGAKATTGGNNGSTTTSEDPKVPYRGSGR